jgi:hypothetical protein
MLPTSAHLGHGYLAAYPRPSLLHRTARPRIRGLGRLEERQDVLGAFSRPLGEESMIGVFQRAPATDGDESGIAHLGEDHGSARLTSSAEGLALDEKRHSALYGCRTSTPTSKFLAGAAVGSKERQYLSRSVPAPVDLPMNVQTSTPPAPIALDRAA